MKEKDYKKFYLIREDVLPESVIKTLQIKDALKKDNQLSIFEAVKQSNLSRSAFYKYRDTIFPVDEKTEKSREFTLILYVDDVIGMLAMVMGTVSSLKLSVLTIHQSLPIDQKATITLSLNAKGSQYSINEIISALKDIDNVSNVELIGMTM
ncbi:ACT domain-containing protein [Staphylococcus massiliensis]|uniref:ACT domain-containing protein n=1 Tax=Staphylococcus massiliensis TaxID=555791 RepID=UPI001EDF7DAE|nr:ACT domain-containing protein [Staphylococcus massiliensis]MCG3400918.1 ACT domain-containing protein [Staphylococcus massiliensis]